MRTTQIETVRTSAQPMFSLASKRGVLTGGFSGSELATCQILATTDADIFSLSCSDWIKVKHDAQSDYLHHIEE